MNIIIREAQPGDYAKIAELNKNEMGYDFPVEDTKRKLNCLLEEKSQKIFVAVADGEVKGYIHANDYDVLYAPHLKDIMGIAVASGYRRNGIGKLLLNAVEDWARSTGACGVRLVSGTERTGAHSFYETCGYTSSKEQKNFKKIFEK